MGNKIVKHRNIAVPIAPAIPEWENTVEFMAPLVEDVEYKVIKVYDGDTITLGVKFDWSNALYRIHVRLRGVDTPEIRSRNPDEKTAATEARDALSDMILGKKVKLYNIGLEKYGRILATVKYREYDLAQYMINEGYGVPYDGGTKLTF